ncbi:MAG: hypothetical protein ACRDKW_18540 [Actinomycetota bacterium]
MQLVEVAGGCSGGTCPTVYETVRGTYVVQGYVVADQEALTALDLPAGESAVEVPADLLRDFVAGLRR